MVALKREFDDGFIEHHPSGGIEGAFGANDLAELLEANPQVKVAPSHHLIGQHFNSNLSLTSTYPFNDFILVRHPLKRLLLIYTYYRPLEVMGYPVISAAQSMSLAEFLNYMLEKHLNHMISPQDTCLSGRGVEPLSGKHLELATARLDEYVVCGTVENYHVTMLVAEHYLKPAFHNQKLHYLIINDSPSPSGYYGTLGFRSSLHKTLEEMNALDIELRDAANGELERRKKLIPDYDELEEEFGTRCRGLRA